MKTASAKAKERRLQQRVRDDLRALAGTRLEPEDVDSTPMGCNGVDVILTPAAKRLFGPCGSTLTQLLTNRRCF
jgi:hypothetical protein